MAKPRAKPPTRQEIVDPKARLKRAKTLGQTPLEFLLEVMRDGRRSKEDRLLAAKAAAPYCHARLQAVHTTVDTEGKSHEEWLLQLERSAAEEEQNG